MSWSAKVALRTDHICADGTCNLILRVRIGRSAKKELPLGWRLRPSDFEERSGRVLPTHKNSNDINLLIGQALAKANKIFVEYRLGGKELTLARFTHDYQHTDSRDDFMAFFRREMTRRKNKSLVTDSTTITERTLYLKLEKFRQFWLQDQGLDEHRPLYFSDIDRRWMEDFDAWHLKKLKKEVGKSLVNNGAAPRWNATKKLKAFLRLANEVNGVLINASALTFTSPMPVERKCALTKAQFHRLIELEKSTDTAEHLRQVIRYFIFGCLTGLRYSDVSRLRWDSIEGDQLEYQAYKTRNLKLGTIKVPLMALAIGMLPERRHGKVFDCFCNQVTNRHLKEIAKLGELPKNLSFKWSRDTFATLFLELGGSVEVLQQMLGHTKIQQTMKYVTVTEQRKRSQMAGFDSLV